MLLIKEGSADEVLPPVGTELGKKKKVLGKTAVEVKDVKT